MKRKRGGRKDANQSEGGQSKLGLLHWISCLTAVKGREPMRLRSEGRRNWNGGDSVERGENHCHHHLQLLLAGAVVFNGCILDPWTLVANQLS